MNKDEILVPILTAINDLREEVRDNRRAIQKNTDEIQKNRELIQKNTEEIQKNRELIQKNTQEIQKNRELIQKNTQEIQKNRELIQKNTEAIQINKELIQSNKESIISLESRMEKQEQESRKDRKAILDILYSYEQVTDRQYKENKKRIERLEQKLKIISA